MRRKDYEGSEALSSLTDRRKNFTEDSFLKMMPIPAANNFINDLRFHRVPRGLFPGRRQQS
jgi:hypothetical protein